MKKTYLTTLFMSLLTAGTLFAQPQPSTPNIRKPAGINLSLWKRISTQPNDSTGSTFLNIGLFSSMNNLSGVGMNVFGSRTRHDVCGLQLSGFSSMAGGTMRGIQVAGITNINGNCARGISLSGLVGIHGNQSHGLLASGLCNILGDSLKGVTFAGLLNFASKDGAGLHMAGMANVMGENYKGTALAGILNVTGGRMTGWQASGIANITATDMHGLQTAVIGNVAGNELRGAQIGLLNMAKKAKGVQIGLFNYYKENFDGLQIGLVNYYKENLDGFQLGLVNANPNTRIQPMIFGGTATKFNAGVRFKNNLYYTILGAGTHYLDLNDKFSASFFYRAGIELPLYKQLFISGDLGYQHIETFRNKDYGYPARLYALQARVNLEYRFNEKIGVFLTGGYGGSRYYNKGVTYDKGIIVEGGVVLLSFK